MEKETTPQDLIKLCDELEEAYTPVIPLKQWLFGESPYGWMVADELKEKKRFSPLQS
jgi:hypothetical protein